MFVRFIFGSFRLKCTATICDRCCYCCCSVCVFSWLLFFFFLLLIFSSYIDRNRVSASFNKLTSTIRKEQLCDALLWLSCLRKHSSYTGRPETMHAMLCRHCICVCLFVCVCVCVCDCVQAMAVCACVISLCDFFWVFLRGGVCCYSVLNVFHFGINLSSKYFVELVFFFVRLLSLLFIVSVWMCD